jgi:hypothetical protein
MFCPISKRGSIKTHCTIPRFSSFGKSTCTQWYGLFKQCRIPHPMPVLFDILPHRAGVLAALARIQEFGSYWQVGSSAAPPPSLSTFSWSGATNQDFYRIWCVSRHRNIVRMIAEIRGPVWDRASQRNNRFCRFTLNYFPRLASCCRLLLNTYLRCFPANHDDVKAMFAGSTQAECFVARPL